MSIRTRQTPGVIIAVISKKGGVGKTTTSVNLAAALAALGRRVLLVDLDSQASASRSLGVTRSNLAPSISDVLFSNLPAGDAIRHTSVPNLNLITASVDLVSADVELGGSREREFRLGKVLEPLRPHYDEIILDCPPSLTLLPINALTAADGFVAPVVPHFLAIEGVESLLKTAERVRSNFNRRLVALGILLAMVDYRTNATRQNVALLREEYGRLVFGVEVRINTRLAEAPEHAQTIFQYDPRATGAESHSLLAEEFLLRCKSLHRLTASA
ncbi:MAG: AAA family ATPase [Acidobacteriota bacterium]